jgi:hypothetical protein
VVDHRELSTISEQEYERGVEQRETRSRASILGDEGRLAAALGYDAIRIEGQREHADYYVILNRSATAVQEWVPPTMEPTHPRVRMRALHLKDMLAVGNEYEVLLEDSGNWMHAVGWAIENGRPFLVDKNGSWVGVEGERSFVTRLVKS